MKTKKKILIASPITDSSLQHFNAHFETLYFPHINETNLIQYIHDVDAILVATKPEINSSTIQKAEKLQIIIRLGIGIDHIDLNACKDRDIKLAITPHANIKPVVELLFSQLIQAIRFLPETTNNLYQGKFRSDLTLGRELHNQTLGIIGAGRIGTKVAEIAHVFGMKTLYYDPYRTLTTKLHAEETSLDELRSRADIITLHVPLTQETQNLVDFNFLTQMKEGSILINTSRGAVAPIKTLIDFAPQNHIAKFIIDVYENEPYIPSAKEFPIISKYFTLTPHIGAYTEESIEQRSDEAFEQIYNFFYKKQIPHGLINLSKGY